MTFAADAVTGDSDADANDPADAGANDTADADSDAYAADEQMSK